jgi:hypothetical protein
MDFVAKRVAQCHSANPRVTFTMPAVVGTVFTVKCNVRRQCARFQWDCTFGICLAFVVSPAI